MPESSRWTVVTGAASGIGDAVTTALLERAQNVIGVDIDEDALAERAARQPRFVAAALDVSDPSAGGRLAEVIDAHGGIVSGLVNSAGIGGYTGDVVDTSVEDWKRVIGIDLTGPYLVSKAVVPFMSAGGAIVHVASQYALVGGAGFPAYCAAKAGLLGLTRAMAVDHAPAGIRVNCVCPGPIDTPMLRRSSADTGASRLESARTRARSLLPAPPPAARVATVIEFLLADASGHMTGAVVPVDGGWSAA